jgi:hypothetical protein
MIFLSIAMYNKQSMGSYPYRMEENTIYRFRKIAYQEVGKKTNGKPVKAYVTYEIEAYREAGIVFHTNGLKDCPFNILKTEPEFLEEMKIGGWVQSN